MAETDKAKKENLLSTSLKALKQKESKKILLISIIISLVAYGFLYGMWRIPIVDFGINRISPIGFSDYLFVIIVSFLVSLFLTLFLYEKREKIASTSSVGGIGGGFAGFFAAVCPACQSVGLVAFAISWIPEIRFNWAAWNGCLF